MIITKVVIAWFTTIPTIPRNQIAKSTNMQENYTLVKFPLQPEKAQMLLELTLSNFPTGVVYLQNGYCNCMDPGWTFFEVMFLDASTRENLNMVTIGEWTLKNLMEDLPP